MSTTSQIPLTGNVSKVYFQNPFQKVNAEDINRLSGANTEDSAITLLIQAILTTIGQKNIAYFGFSVSTDGTTISVGPGLIIRSDSIFTFSGVTFIPNSGSLLGIVEIDLVVSETDTKALLFFDNTSKTFEPSPGPSRQSNVVNLYETWTANAPLPSPTPPRIAVLSYTKLNIGTPITNVTCLLPVYDPKLLGIGLSLNPGIGDISSLSSAINSIYNQLLEKSYILTTPIAGATPEKYKIQRQGLYSYWSVDDGGTWHPFA
ncbi:hypothetical protein LEP1GSC050_0014 [Leptospira phage vB_LbrZ_5399-LE1]|uniref:Uncharacterized protein n=1 Tax=Leptospira inadai serovar Lyme TaxID=293084 RepID=A0ABX4YGS1_9LEPT|nr:hypothetical protein [Leptospira inadai]AGS80682.1 hypothetical protein LEP1GSC050_0014 [Leptospira phage vB_LbrZ_5399-LE1]AGS80833.1 hypothetical protein LEP1GSC047_0856 [Leptospira phage vB_LinZ_10-LE1]PNV74374.1 hypothetical protein BES34_014415 [Leptospira inadai serovar Lyme]